MPFQLIYSSWAAPDLDMADLTAMLAESRTRNQTSGITGVLVLVDGVFFQILEGEKGDVLDLTKRIIVTRGITASMCIASGRPTSAPLPRGAWPT